MSSRSLNVPGSPSSAFSTTYRWVVALLGRHGAPLHVGREARAAASLQAGGFSRSSKTRLRPQFDRAPIRRAELGLDGVAGEVHRQRVASGRHRSGPIAHLARGRRPRRRARAPNAPTRASGPVPAAAPPRRSTCTSRQDASDCLQHRRAPRRTRPGTRRPRREGPRRAPPRAPSRRPAGGTTARCRPGPSRPAARSGGRTTRRRTRAPRGRPSRARPRERRRASSRRPPRASPGRKRRRLDVGCSRGRVYRPHLVGG